MKIKFNNYQEYKKQQTILNKNKINNIWIDDTEVKIISDHIKLNIDSKCLSFGICHGSRNGYEVKKFIELLNIEVIGTDISETANNFSNMIVHDFHDLKLDWIKKCDFIYTNSLDHSYDPDKFLTNNILHLKDYGFIYIEHSDYHLTAKNYGDCFGATLDEYLFLIKKYFLVTDVLSINSDKGVKQNRKVIIGKKI